MINQLLLFRIVLLLWLSKAIALAVAQSTACEDMCGDVPIPYPFGIGAGCYKDEWFNISCNKTFNPPKAFITSIDLQLLEVSLENATVRVNSPVFSTNCETYYEHYNHGPIILSSSPFSFSDSQNKFTGMGCNSFASINNVKDEIIGGCVSICNVSTVLKNSCYGVDCCQTTIPQSLGFLNASFSSVDPQKDDGDCKSAFIVEQDWFTSNVSDIHALQVMEYVPAVLDWKINCTDEYCYNYSCSTNAGRILSTNVGTDYYICECLQGYRGNPYLSQGCQDIDECSSGRNYCNGDMSTCINTPGSFRCVPKDRGNKSPVVFIGLSTSFGTLLLLLCGWGLYKVVKRRKEIMLKKKFFKQNGGLLLQQQLSTGEGEGNVEKTKLFTSKELEKATDQYNENRILGQGGQGTVYKGMLIDGRIVAIKKSKIVDEDNLHPFINEVVILSQLNHRNVVKLLGCCLEAEVPLLVYEYIPNGTLFQYIHDQNEEFPVSWEMYLQIATEVAGALFYLHSAASISIYHRDVKSSNILLDDKYRAKVSDFGTSRLIAVDQTHLTTRVLGTFGYLDPEYFQSSQFTEKSDVYSFGVVLVELLTKEKAISSSTNSEERKSLAARFIEKMEKNCLFDILDPRVVKEGGKEEIMAVANLAKRCLNSKREERPTMKEVATELEAIKKSQDGSTVRQNSEQVEYELTGPWDGASTSSGSHMANSLASTLDAQPLLFNTA